MNATAPSPPDVALLLLASELHTAFVAKCLASAALALVLYEYLLTLSNEITLLWFKVPSAASLLYLLLRVILLAIAGTTIAGNYVPVTTETLSGCKSYNIWYATLTMIGYIMIAVISAVRVFAVTSRNWPLSLLTFALGLAPIVINIYLLTTAHYLVERVPTTTVCAVLSTVSTKTANHYMRVAVALASRLCVILSDVCVVSATWFSLFHSARLSVKSGIFNGTLSWYLLRDGTLYFSIILCLNLIDIFLWWFKRIQFFTTLIFPLSLILLSRLLVNLRQAAHTQGGIGSHTSSTGKSSADLPTQMSDVLFVPQSIPDSGTTEFSTSVATLSDEEDLEMAEVAIMDEDSPIDEVSRLEANVVK